jgi:hypothetical protein
MACSQSLAGVAVEVLVEQHQVTPVRVGMEAFEVAVGGPPALSSSETGGRAGKVRRHGIPPAGDGRAAAACALRTRKPGLNLVIRDSPTTSGIV